MITVPAGVRVYLAMGPTDMRKGIDGLSVLEPHWCQRAHQPRRRGIL
jgi:hypothetical protein